ncbi:hypothetical protein ACWEOE_05925 [Amycolatopsis sp. NPDC004368]
MAKDEGWRTLPDGRRIKIGKGKGSAGALVALGAAALVAGGAGLGALGGASGEAAISSVSEALSGNSAGDVVDSLPGRSMKARSKAGQQDAEAGNAKKAWSRVKMKELKRKVGKKLEREADCVAAASDRVRDYLIRTPCTALDRMLLTVGDGHGNAAIVSVVRVGFKTKSQAEGLRRVETVQGSGDIRPLEIAATLGLTGLHFTGLNYQDRVVTKPAGLYVAEADRAAGKVDHATLQALAEIAVHMPIG